MGTVYSTIYGDQEAEVEIQETPVGEKLIDGSEEQTEDCQSEDSISDGGNTDIEDSQSEDSNSEGGNTDIDFEENSIMKADYETLPECIKRRIKAMRKLQEKIVESDVEFFEKVFELEIQYDKRRQNIFEKRLRIISGEHEPTDEECDYPSPYESPNITERKLKLGYPNYEENVKGIPNFWLTVFNNSSYLRKYFHEDDEPLLSHLQDIKVKLQESPAGYTLEFYFSDNDYFTNRVLTKFYELNFKPDEDFPLEYEVFETIDCKGSKIEWKEGKNITLKNEDKTDEKETKVYLGQSFFDFFNPPVVPEDASTDVEEDITSLLDQDYDLGEFLKERLIPRATLYYTGEEFDDDDD